MDNGTTSPREVSCKDLMFIAGSPSPAQYNLGTEFHSTPGTRAISFGIAREAYSKVYIKEAVQADPSVPGPGQYSVTPMIGNEANKYTSRPKTVNPCKLLFL